MKKKALKLFAVGLALCLVAGGIRVRTVDALGTKEEIEERKRQAQEEQETLRGIIERLEGDKETIEQKIALLDEQIVEISNRIETLDASIEEYEGKIEQNSEKLAEARDNERLQYEAMQKRIQFLYENGNMDYVATMLSSNSITSVLNRSEYVTQISKYDYRMLTKLVETRKSIANAETLLEADKKAAEDLKQIKEEDKKNLEVAQAAKASQLKATEKSIATAESEYDMYEEEVAKYDAELEEIERRAIAAAQAQNDQSGGRNYDDGGNGGGADGGSIEYDGDVPTNYSGGKLQWPMPASHRISSKFGPRNTGIKGASTNHKGIDIKCPSGSKVVAAESGVVVAVSYNSARGHYCMISHGGGLTTLYQHCTKITVSVGDKVSRGAQIALSGSTGISSGPHLHFEVRLNQTPVNPLPYLQ